MTVCLAAPRQVGVAPLLAQSGGPRRRARRKNRRYRKNRLRASPETHLHDKPFLLMPRTNGAEARGHSHKLAPLLR
jgi:hypothetical protein